MFKTAADPFVGKLSYFRVYSGTFKSDSQLQNANRGEAERIGQVFEVRGRDQEAVPELAAGDIGAVSKLNSVLTGDSITSREQPMILGGLEFPTPVYMMAVYPKTKADVDKMTSSLARIAEEDPSLVLTREPDTNELIMGGLGDTHLDVAIEKMQRKFGVEMVLDIPRVPYKETISGRARVEYRHKKQTGGTRTIRSRLDRGGAAAERNGIRVRQHHRWRRSAARVHTFCRKGGQGRAE